MGALNEEAAPHPVFGVTPRDRGPAIGDRRYRTRAGRHQPGQSSGRTPAMKRGMTQPLSFPRRPPGRHRGARRKQEAPRALTTAGGRLSREVFKPPPPTGNSNEATWRRYALLSTVAYFQDYPQR